MTPFNLSRSIEKEQQITISLLVKQRSSSDPTALGSIEESLDAVSPRNEGDASFVLVSSGRLKQRIISSVKDNYCGLEKFPNIH